GWDISSLDLASATARAKVLGYDIQRQVAKHLSQYKPLPSIYYPTFIAANQSARADNLIPGNDKWSHVEHIRNGIRAFREKHNLDKVIVVWTANTERHAEISEGGNDTAENLLKSVKDNHQEIAPSAIFAISCILGCVELAEQRKSFIAGDDFKSGQTKIKSVLAQFLVDAGIRPLSIVSYNH